MKKIDLDTWNRRPHYEFFRRYQNPFFNVCFELDVTAFLRRIKAKGQPFFLTFLHAAVTASNRTEAFRLRLRGAEVVLHDTVHPAFTMMTDAGVFRFFTAPFTERLDDYLKTTEAAMEEAKKTVYVADEDGVDDLLYVTSMPWLVFTAVEHAMPGTADDSVPRLTWGKHHEVGGLTMIPFSVAAHHALVDGADVARFARTLQELLDGNG